MIRAWRYVDGGAGTAFTGEDCYAAIGQRDHDGLIWIDLDAPSAVEIERVGAVLGIHHLSVEDLVNRGQRTKLERYDDHCHVVFRDCRYEPPGGSHLISLEVDLLFGSGWVVSFREAGDDGEEPASIEEARTRFERQRFEHGSTDEGFAVWAIVDAIVDRYFKIVDHTDDALEILEDAVFAETGDGAMSPRAYTLRRSMLAFRRAITPLREVLAVILRGEIGGFTPTVRAHFHDVNDHVLRILDLLETQRELLADLRDSQLSIASNRMNRVMKATSSWGAILVMNTLIAGIYGMNFRHMPELAWYWGYPFSLGLMGVITFVGYRVFKHRDWL